VALIAKLGNPEMLGEFSLAAAIVTPVLMLSGLQLRVIQATDIDGRFAFGDYLALRLLSTSFGVALIAAIAFGSGLRRQTALVVAVFGLARAFESISDVFYGRLQRCERMDRISISLMLRGALSVLTVGCAVAATGSVLWAVSCVALAWVVTLILYDARNSDWGGLRDIRWTTLANLTKLAAPLGLTMMLISVNASMPRYFIERHLGERELGIFAAIAYLPLAGTTIMRALGEAATPKLSRHYANADASAMPTLLWKLIAIAATLAAAGVLIAVLAGRTILGLLYRPEYAAAAGVLIWITAAEGIGFITSMLGYAATARRRLRYQPLALCAVIAVSAVAGYYLVPPHHLHGAAFMMLAASLTGFLAYGSLLLSGTSEV